MVALLLALITSCGSSGSDSSEPDAATSSDDGAAASTTNEAETVDDGEPPTSEAESAAAGSGLGSIEIDGVRHELTITRCLQMSGAIAGAGVSVTEPENIEVTFDFSPQDWADRTSEGWTENGTVRIDSEEPYRQWESGQSLLELYNLPDGLDRSALDITSYTIADDGQSVTGEATFIELTALMSGAEVKPIPGTFSFSCPPSG